jgi:hypothetical protein
MIRSQIPNFSLEDKANAEGGSVVRTHTAAEEDSPQEPLIHSQASGPKALIVYSRRKGKKGNNG